jgi:hypothetical protein
MPSPQIYMQGSSFENFINQAHKYYGQSLKNGASGSYMTNLIEAEQGNNSVKHLGTFEKQLIKVKEYINKAIDAFLKPSRKLKEDEKLALMELKNRLNNAYSTSQLLSIVQQGLEITQPYKDY